MDNGLSVLAAIGIRTSFEITSAKAMSLTSSTFGGKIEELHNDGKLSADEKKIVTTLVEAGNAAAHRGWKPSDDQLTTVMEILEGFIHRSIVLPEKVKELAPAIPKRK